MDRYFQRRPPRPPTRHGPQRAQGREGEESGDNPPWDPDADFADDAGGIPLGPGADSPRPRRGERADFEAVPVPHVEEVGGGQVRPLSSRGRPSSSSSRIGTRSGVIGVSDHMNYAGPYTPWIRRHMRAVQLFGRQFVRTVPMGDGTTKIFHCVLMRSGNNAQVRVPGLAWDSRRNRIMESSSKIRIKRKRVPLLNMWAQYMQEYGEEHGSLEGARTFENWSLDHLCHLNPCWNWNHHTLSDLTVNQGRGGCPGPRCGCRHGERGVPCQMPGQYCTGEYNLDVDKEAVATFVEQMNNVDWNHRELRGRLQMDWSYRAN